MSSTVITSGKGLQDFSDSTGPVRGAVQRYQEFEVDQRSLSRPVLFGREQATEVDLELLKKLADCFAAYLVPAQTSHGQIRRR